MEATIAVFGRAYIGTKNSLLKSIQCAREGERQGGRERETPGNAHGACSFLGRVELTASC